MSRYGSFARNLRDAGIARWQRLAQGPRWDLLAAALYTLVSLALYLGASVKNPGADGHYSWMFARSLAYDGDLDFTNDYAQCGDPFGIGLETAAHRPANFFYIGPAVFWTPVIWVLKHFVTGRFANGCRGTIPNVTLAMSSLAGGVMVLATSATLRRWFSPRLSAFSTLLVTLGGHLIYFTGMNPSYSHAYDAMCVAAFLYFTVRMREEPERRGLWVLAGAFLGLAILQRAIDVVFFAVTIAALGLRWRPMLVVGLVSFVTGVAPLLSATHAIAGRWAIDTHGPHFIAWGHAHPILLVFDQVGGVFAMAPLLWLAVPGAILLLRRRELRFLVLPVIACGLFELYVSSAALDWQGARRLVNLTPLAALSVASLLEPLVRWLVAERHRPAWALALGSIGAASWAQAGVSVGYRVGRVPWDQPVSLGARYGQGQAAIIDETEDAVGPLTAFPASWLFALRYRVKPAAYAWGTHPGAYTRNTSTLEWVTTTFSFASPERGPATRGFRFEAEHACFTHANAAVIVALQWPVATRARIVYDATADATLAVSSRSFFGQVTPWERVTLARGTERDTYVRIPKGGVDSGVNEIEFELAGKPRDVCLRGVELMDDTIYPASPDSRASFPVTIWHARQSTQTRERLLASIQHPSRDGRFRDLVVSVEARGDSLVMKAGGMELSYDAGKNPAIVIDEVTGHGIEVHDGSGGVWTHDIDVIR